MEPNGWSPPQMLRRYGARARSARVASGVSVFRIPYAASAIFNDVWLDDA
jgi:hypothetical protein